MFRDTNNALRLPSKRARIAAAVLTLGALALSACSSSTTKSAASAGSTTASLDTLSPGVIKVAIEAYAPYTSENNGHITGLDADILNAAAGKLGLTVQPVVTDFAGMLASVQSHRVDITIGGVAWTAERQKQGLFTDPLYYSSPAMAVASGKTFHTVDDLQNQQLGTVEGYVWVKSIKAVPGATLHAYPDATSVFSDLSAGRISAAFLDPLIIIDAQKHGEKIQTQYLMPPTAEQIKAHPDYSYFAPYMTGFYLPKQEPKVEAALDAQIRAMYTSGEMSALITKYGGDPQQFLTPAPDFAAARQGVDRPANWTPPSG